MSKISIQNFKEVWEKNFGSKLFFDVREPAEYRAEHLSKTENIPLSKIAKTKKIDLKTETIYLICKSGKRSEQAQKILEAGSNQKFICVEGGLDAWKKANLPIETNQTSSWSLERQVRFAAGFLVVVGIILSQTAWPGFIWLSGFVGAGLIFAAVTDTCGMAMILAKMPWNR